MRNHKKGQTGIWLPDISEIRVKKQNVELQNTYTMEENDYVVRFVEKYQKDILYFTLIVFIIWLLSQQADYELLILYDNGTSYS